MGKRRTRKDKVSAQHVYTYKLEPEIGQAQVKLAGPKTTELKIEKTNIGVLGFDPHLVRTDMYKTILVSAIVLGVELTVYWYLLG